MVVFLSCVFALIIVLAAVDRQTYFKYRSPKTVSAKMRKFVKLRVESDKLYDQVKDRLRQCETDVVEIIFRRTGHTLRSIYVQFDATRHSFVFMTGDTDSVVLAEVETFYFDDDYERDFWLEMLQDLVIWPNVMSIKFNEKTPS